MSADILRRAASLMRERAESAEFDTNGCFVGFAKRECGEHRTVGSHRAWCFDCGEWCYPESPCMRCGLGGSQEFVLAVAALLDGTAADIDAGMQYLPPDEALAVARAYLGGDA